MHEKFCRENAPKIRRLPIKSGGLERLMSSPTEDTLNESILKYFIVADDEDDNEEIVFADLDEIYKPWIYIYIYLCNIQLVYIYIYTS